MKKKTIAKSFAMIVFLIAVSQGDVFAGPGWTAYHDLSVKYSTTGNHPNTTVFYWDSRTSELIKISDGTGTGVSILVDPVGGTDGGVAGTGYPAIGTEAYNEFNGFIDLDAYIYGSGGNASGAVPMTLSGLDPTKTYEVVIFANRGGNYDDRYTRMSITGADSFVNNSTTGASISGANDETTSIMSGNQSTTGQVFRYSDIKAGADGIVVIDVLAGDRNYLNAFKLTEAASGPVVVPDAAELNISLAGASLSIGSTNLSAEAGVTNFLQVKADLDNTWSNLYFATGVTETNWVVPSTLPKNFFRIETSY